MYKIFWDEIYIELKRELPTEEFSMWFNQLQYQNSENGKLVLSVPSAFFRDQMKDRYLKKMEKMLSDLTGTNIEITFHVRNKETNTEISDKQKTENIKPEKNISFRKHPKLKEEFTFENFVSGENNNFAYNAALAISKNPGKVYNPFLIYGGVGLGKTHLLEAIGNSIYNEFTDKKVVFVTAEEFTNEFIESIKNKKNNEFKNKYRTVDVLLIDDIHFFQKKDAVQEEMFNTFNTLYNSKKQMCFTCDRPPSELENLTERMKSRFNQGLVVDLQIPSYETRLAILRKKTSKLSVNIKNEVLEFLAQNITTSIRELESALTTVSAYSTLVKQEVSVENIENIISIPTSKTENISIDIIIKCVADYFNIQVNDIKGKKRVKNIALARQIAIYLTRNITELSTSEIGNEFDRDHSTVLHAINKMEDEIKYDTTLDTVINRIKSSINENLLKN